MTRLTDKGRAIRQMFDDIAPRYDLLNRLLSFGIDRRWRRRAVGQLRVPAGGRVLDVATGTGDVALEIARQTEALERGEEDQLNQSLYRVPDGKHVTYEELLADVDPKIAQELTPERLFTAFGCLDDLAVQRTQLMLHFAERSPHGAFESRIERTDRLGKRRHPSLSRLTGVLQGPIDLRRHA